MPTGNASARGIRIGIIAREDEDEAWRIARTRFPEDRKGQLTHQLAMKVSDSHWHKQLSEASQANGMREGAYWMWPFENYKTFCPYLVGDFDAVSDEVARYLRLGYSTFILDIPREQRDLDVTREVFRLALEKVGGALPGRPESVARHAGQDPH